MKKARIKDITLPLREDGRVTRKHIIEGAGRLSAQYGYAHTTSKSICKKAGVNLAAVNYHFGSRDGLYVAVLNEVQDFLVNIGELNRIAESALAPRDKIERMLTFFIENAFLQDDWHVKVWARELLTPSPFINQIISTQALPKLNIVLRLLSEYLGLSQNNSRLYAVLLSVLSPLAVLFLTQDSLLSRDLPIRFSVSELITQLRANTILLLDSIRTQQDSASSKSVVRRDDSKPISKRVIPKVE